VSGLFGALLELLARLVRNWPRKLVALAAAFGFWWLVGTTTTTITQRSFVIPLQVEGVEAEDLAVGVPDVVEVSVSGPGPRIDRLRPDQLLALLDLTDVTGDFERQIVVQTPQEVRLLSVTPSSVIGFLETVAQRTIPVEVGIVGAPPDGTVVRAAATPPQVRMTGRQQQLDRVARAVAFVDPSGGRATVIALDGAEQPVAGIAFDPPAVQVAVGSREVLYTAAVLVELAAPADAAIVSATLTRPTATLAGPQAALAELESVTATVEPLTGEVAPGRYTLPVRLELPDGVVAVSTPSAVLQYVTAPVEP